MSDPRHFDRVAAIYRPMEYLSFGPFLERCRFSFVKELTSCRLALVLGDGDGRFLARLLGTAPALHAYAVDGSPAMLRRLRARLARLGAHSRLTTTCADIRADGAWDMPSSCDLVATHFFLDCLTPHETDDLVARIRPNLAPGAIWIVSEFEVPLAGVWRAALGRLIIGGLYRAFGVLTGLQVRQIPPWRSSLSRAGFVRRSARSELGGLLVSELWQLPRATGPCHTGSQWTVPTSPVLDTPGSVPGIDPGPEPAPVIPPAPEPEPAPGPSPEPDPQPYPGPIPAPRPIT